MQTIYKGHIGEALDGWNVTVETPVLREIRPLDPRFDLRNHSPDGFAWGYSGSGPSQLALALLASATGDDDLATTYYHRFKEGYVARLDKDKPWEITREALLELVRQMVRLEGPFKTLGYGIRREA